MVKYDKRCNVCKIIQLEGGKDSPLLRRIFDSRQFMPNGEPLTEILADYHADLKYLSLYNHAKKHQSLEESELEEKKIKAMERSVSEAKTRRLITTKDFRDILKDEAMSKLEAGEVKGFTVSSITKLLKDEDDVVAKQKDQQFKAIMMIEQFASGALTLTEGEDYTVGDYSKLPDSEA